MLSIKKILPYLFLLSGCGFTPIYEKKTVVKISLIANREGQILRNELTKLLGGENPQYFLDVLVTSSDGDIGIRKDAITARRRITVSAKYSLYQGSRSGKLLKTDTLALSVAHSFVDEAYYGNKASAESQKEAALKLLAQDITTEVRAFLKYEAAP